MTDNLSFVGKGLRNYLYAFTFEMNRCRPINLSLKTSIYTPSTLFCICLDLINRLRHMLRFLFTQKRSSLPRQSPCAHPKPINHCRKGKTPIYAVDLGQTKRLTYGADTQQINTNAGRNNLALSRTCWPRQALMPRN